MSVYSQIPLSFAGIRLGITTLQYQQRVLRVEVKSMASEPWRPLAR